MKRHSVHSIWMVAMETEVAPGLTQSILRASVLRLLLVLCLASVAAGQGVNAAVEGVRQDVNEGILGEAPRIDVDVLAPPAKGPNAGAFGHAAARTRSTPATTRNSVAFEPGSRWALARTSNSMGKNATSLELKRQSPPTPGFSESISRTRKSPLSRTGSPGRLNAATGSAAVSEAESTTLKREHFGHAEHTSPIIAPWHSAASVPSADAVKRGDLEGAGFGRTDTAPTH